MDNKNKEHVKRTQKTYNYESWIEPHCSKFTATN
jgi:hypothetical protein